MCFRRSNRKCRSTNVARRLIAAPIPRRWRRQATVRALRQRRARSLDRNRRCDHHRAHRRGRRAPCGRNRSGSVQPWRRWYWALISAVQRSLYHIRYGLMRVIVGITPRARRLRRFDIGHGDERRRAAQGRDDASRCGEECRGVRSIMEPCSIRLDIDGHSSKSRIPVISFLGRPRSRTRTAACYTPSPWVVV
jgi:hypothetical protein